MTRVALLATLDTKGDACRVARDRLRDLDCDVVVLDVGVLGAPALRPDVERAAVAAAAGADLHALAADRGTAIEAMGRGAAVLVGDLVRREQVDAVLALGGSAGASIAAAVFAGLPLGFPKVLVSPVAAGDTRPYVAGDVVLVHPVVDLAETNPVTARVLRNAAAAVAGMARSGTDDLWAPGPQVAITAFGITTPAVDAVSSHLRERGCVPLVFSANGAGGDAAEDLVAAGAIAAVADLTTTELADRLVGGILPAGPRRLEAAGARGVPQVVSVGALDVVNFGPAGSVPRQFRGRRLHGHNPQVTLMRTTPDECGELGRELATKVNAGRGPRTVVLPLRGVSALSAPGGPFHDPEADRALFGAVRDTLHPDVGLVEVDCFINDPRFATAVAECLDAVLGNRKESHTA